MVDKMWELAEAQTLAGSAHDTTYCVDMTAGTQGKDAFGNAINIDIGAAKLYFNVKVTTATAAGACRIGLFTHSAASSFKSGSQLCEVYVPSGAAIGDCFSTGVNPQSVSWQRYIGGVIDTASNACTGNVDIWVDIAPCTANKLPH